MEKRQKLAIALIILGLLLMSCFALSFHRNSRIEEFSSFSGSACLYRDHSKELHLLRIYAEKRSVNGKLDLSPLRETLSSGNIFSLQQIFSSSQERDVSQLLKHSDPTSYDWAFLQYIVRRSTMHAEVVSQKAFLDLLKRLARYPVCPITKDVSLKRVREFDVDKFPGYEADANFMQIFSEKDRNVVLLVTDFNNFKDSGTNNITEKTYDDDLVRGYSDLPANDKAVADLASYHRYTTRPDIEKPLQYKCQRFFQNCQDKVRVYG